MEQKWSTRPTAWWAIQVEMPAKTGEQMRATSSLMQMASGMQILQPQRLEVGGKTLTMTAPSQPAPYAASGVIRALNYGVREGQWVRVAERSHCPNAPFDASGMSILRPGASISISGFACATASGRTVVEVQSIAANGRTITMNAVPPAPPDASPPAPPPIAAGTPITPPPPRDP